jgi:hypothetical protein
MSLFDQLQEAEEQQKQKLQAMSTKSNAQQKQTPTRKITQSRDTLRELSSEKPRISSRKLPTRDEIQEFSFRLRDELKVKVQAEVPHEWQDELEDLARKLDVKKLELYRYIIGEFLGKVQRRGREE